MGNLRFYRRVSIFIGGVALAIARAGSIAAGR